jgi:alpha-amylase/alpha-mannosidase (GH57 family)
MSSRFPRYVVIHGHFYQPPRENPWTEVIERQDSAAPYHDWNERIASECYIPNGIARVIDQERKIIDLVNNYAYISYNFGPTLLSWYEANHRREYERLLRADERSLKRWGFGNAIAQAYNHRILPLAPRRSKVLQIEWGIADFKHRFGRHPDSLWLPETACNPATLEALHEAGMKYLILAPTQAGRIRPFGSSAWIDVHDGSIDPRRAYRHYLSDDQKKYIDIFFYDGHLAREIAFQKLMKDGNSCANRFEACFDRDAKEPQIVHAATDGESYGHHQPFADMTLGFLAKYEFAVRGITVTNYAHYLNRHPPTWEVEIKEGPDGQGTAWSCSHGLSRWKEDCGCGGGGGTHQKWRAPLKKAVDWLEDETSFLYDEMGPSYFKDPSRALLEYIRVILDRSEENVRSYLETHLKDPSRVGDRQCALKLLEMQRHVQLMHTSCGWFFSEISGIETVQNLRYAARVMQLAREVEGPDFEKDFLNRLSQAPSNRADLANGRNVYTRIVLPSVVTFNRVLAHMAMDLLFKPVPEDSHFYSYRIRRLALHEKVTITRKMIAGRILITNLLTEEEREEEFFAVYVPYPKLILRVYSKTALADRESETMRDRIDAFHDVVPFQAIEQFGAEYFGGPFMTFKDLFADEREKILSSLLREKFEKLTRSYKLIFKEFLPVLEEFHELGEKLPAHVRGAVEFVIREETGNLMKRYAEDRNLEILVAAKPFLTQARRYEIGVVSPENEHLIAAVLLEEFNRFRQEWTLEQCGRLAAIVEFASQAGFSEWRYRMENQVFSVLVENVYPRLREASGAEARLLDAVVKLAESLNINVKASLKVFEESRAAAT